MEETSRARTEFYLNVSIIHSAANDEKTTKKCEKARRMTLKNSRLESFSRRAFQLTSAVALACGRRRGTAFPGYAFVANAEGRSLAIVDLTVFAVARRIPLDASPTAVIAHPEHAVVYVLTPANGTVVEVDVATLAIRRKLRLGASAVGMRLAPDSLSLWVLMAEPRQLARVPLDRFAAAERIRLSGVPWDFDLSADSAAASFPEQGAVGVMPLNGRGPDRLIPTGGDPRLVRFRFDGRQIVAGDRAGRRITICDTATGRIIVRLPLPVEPENFCFKPDGGQLFVTGKGMDGVVSVHPYETEIGETMLAGRAPGAMAVCPQPEYLFVASPESGDVTVIEIGTRRVLAVLTVGQEPGFIAITPDSQYALVLNHRSGDLAVIRIASISQRRNEAERRSRTAPLFTLIPVGSGPVSAAVRRV
jgi:YVTN family beta-propeller protein